MTNTEILFLVRCIINMMNNYTPCPHPQPCFFLDFFIVYQSIVK